jgi:hypothetical protein
VHGVLVYIRIIKLVDSHSTWARTTDKQIPGIGIGEFESQDNDSKTWWNAGIWLQELLRRKLFWHARSFLLQIGGHISVEAFNTGFEAISTALIKLDNSNETIQCIRGFLGVKRYWIFKQNGSSEAAASQLDESFISFDATDTPLAQHITYPRLFFEVNFAKIDQYQDLNKKAEEWDRLARYAIELGDLQEEWQARYNIIDQAITHISTKTALSHLQRLRKIDGELQPDLTDLMNVIVKIWAVSGVQHNALLNRELDNFELNHPMPPGLLTGAQDWDTKYEDSSSRVS